MDERDGNDSGMEWEALGVHAWAVDQWKRAGFSPFEAAMAQGDGFTPMFAVQYRRTLGQSADAWIRAAIEPLQALQLHRRGITARQFSKQRPDLSSLSPSSQPGTARVMAKGASK